MTKKEIAQITKIANELGWSVTHHSKSNQFSFQRFSGEEQDFWLEDELSDDDYNLLQSYGGLEWREDVQECLDELENLNPEEDIDYFCNCQDTHIRFTNHEKTYRRLFKIEIEEIEHDMGFEFY